MPIKLKQLVLKCLSEQKNRPSLDEIKDLVRCLLRESFFENEHDESVRKIGKYGYVSSGRKMKKRIPMSDLKTNFSNHSTDHQKMVLHT